MTGPCVPVGDLAIKLIPLDTCRDGHLLICRWDWCRKPITHVWMDNLRDWTLETLDGKWGCSEPVPGGGSVYDLLDRLAEAGKTNDAAINAYSSLKARVTLGFHSYGLRPHQLLPGHGCGVEEEHSKPEPPPYCCGMPMWFTGEGWRCRVNGTWFPFAS